MTKYLVMYIPLIYFCIMKIFTNIENADIILSDVEAMLTRMLGHVADNPSGIEEEFERETAISFLNLRQEERDREALYAHDLEQKEQEFAASNEFLRK